MNDNVYILKQLLFFKKKKNTLLLYLPKASI